MSLYSSMVSSLFLNFSFELNEIAKESLAGDSQT